MEKEGGVYKIPCKINGLKLKMIFDTGASTVCISEAVASMMLENDYLSPDDFVGTSKSVVADGRIIDNSKIILRKVELGDFSMTNILAVVVHNQSAPLLFGQSAMEQIGKYTIRDGKLILGTPELNSNNFDQILSDEERELIYLKALVASMEGAYDAAIDNFERLKNNGLLPLEGFFKLADCYYYTNKTDDALSVYLSIQKDVEIYFPEKKGELIFQIARCLWLTDDYDNAIKYLKQAIYYNDPWGYRQKTCIFALASIYSKKGQDTQSRYVVDNYIEEYLKFMDIKPTDCWTKKYKDEFLADLYHIRFLYSDFYRTGSEKYNIISAAWGNSDAIEYCKENKINYRVKPYKYEY